MLSKSLIQFSDDGWFCVPSLLFDLRPNYGASFKRPHACTATLRAPNPTAGYCQCTPLSKTPGNSQASLGQSLVGSLLLSSGSWCIQVSVSALQEPVSPVLCKFWCLYGGVNETSSKRVYAIQDLLYPEPTPLQQSTTDPYLLRRHSNTALSQSLWGLWDLVCTRYVTQHYPKAPNFQRRQLEMMSSTLERTN